MVKIWSDAGLNWNRFCHHTQPPGCSFFTLQCSNYGYRCSDRWRGSCGGRQVIIRHNTTSVAARKCSHRHSNTSRGNAAGKDPPDTPVGSCGGDWRYTVHQLERRSADTHNSQLPAAPASRACGPARTLYRASASHHLRWTGSRVGVISQLLGGSAAVCTGTLVGCGEATAGQTPQAPVGDGGARVARPQQSSHNSVEAQPLTRLTKSNIPTEITRYGAVFVPQPAPALPRW